MPHVRRKVFVGVADARVNDRDDDFAGGSPEVPAVRRVDVSAGSAAILTEIVEIPLIAVQIMEIIWLGQNIYDVIRLGALHEAAPLISGEDVWNGRHRGDFDYLPIRDSREMAQNTRAQA